MRKDLNTQHIDNVLKKEQEAFSFPPAEEKASDEIDNITKEVLKIQLFDTKRSRKVKLAQVMWTNKRQIF